MEKVVVNGSATEAENAGAAHVFVLMAGVPAASVMVWPRPASTTGAVFTGGLTTIVTSAVEDSAVSLAVSRKTYVPTVENVAVVFSALAFAKVTGAGPLNSDQVVRRVPFGKPSSVAVPERLASAVLSSGG